MEFRHLTYFVGVATELNLTKAAQKLHVAQPALSRQIHQLEDELGVQLFQRHTRGMELTAAGKAFYKEACALLKQAQQAVATARQKERNGPMELRLGYVWGLFHSQVPDILRRFRLNHPEAVVHLFDLSANQQASDLKEGKIDGGFIGFAMEADLAGLAKRKIGSCRFLAALPIDHPAVKMKAVHLKTLANEFFLGISEDTYPGASRYVTEACIKAGFKPKILDTVERGFTILGLVASKCGVALLPESLESLPHPGVAFRPLKSPPIGDLFFAWKANLSSTVLTLFLDSLDQSL